MQAMMAQAQKMQKQLQERLAAFDKKQFEYDYKNGSIVVIIKGDFTIVKVNINKVLIDPDDKEMLQDMIAEAINAAYDGVKADRDAIQDSLTPKMPGMF